MVFRLQEQQTARCPGCGEENAGSDLGDIEWYIYTAYNPMGTNTNESRSGNTICGITYRNIVEESAARTNESNTSPRAESERGLLPGSEPQLRGPSQANPSTNDEMQYYTRLHIVTQAIVNRFEDVESKVLDSFRNFAIYEKNRLADDRRKRVKKAKRQARKIQKSPPLVRRIVNLKPSPSPDYLPPPERSPTPERLSTLSSLNSRDKKRHPKAQASQGDAVLIDFMGMLNHPDLATKAGEVPLPQFDDSDVDDPMDVDGREQKYEKKLAYYKTVDLIHLAENALPLVERNNGHDASKNEHSRPARPKILTRPSLPESKTGDHVKPERQPSPSAEASSPKRAKHEFNVSRPLSRSSHSKGDTDSAAISPLLRRFTIPNSERSPAETLPALQ